MSAVSQSYPNYLGGLNEQPDELKKPGQLVEALNVIPDPVYGLVRRPGFERIAELDIDPDGTWFEYTTDNQINDDEFYIGNVTRGGTVRMFNQRGEEQDVKYAEGRVSMNATYQIITDQLRVLDERGNVESTHELNDTPLNYFGHNGSDPLKYTSAKNHIIFTNPSVVPVLSEESFENQKRYYSFVQLKINDTDNYDYLFKVFKPDDGNETYDEIVDLDMDVKTDIDADWDEDNTLPLDVNSPFEVKLTKYKLNGVEVDVPEEDQAKIEVSFAGQVVQLQSSNTGDYRNEARYTPTFNIIFPGKGYPEGAVSRATITTDYQDGEQDVDLKFTVTESRQVVATKHIPIDPGVSADMTTDQILSSLRDAFENTGGIDKALIVGNGIFLSDPEPFSVSTTEVIVAGVINSQIIDDEKLFPIAVVNSVAELPLECKDGFVVMVNNGTTTENAYYLKYFADSNTDSDLNSEAEKTLTKSDGFWQEVAKPFQKNSPGSSSLPHMITLARNRTDTRFVFVVSKIRYANRKVGDISYTPSLFNDGVPITSLNYYKNRLFFFTKIGGIVSSKAGEPGNLFPETALTTSAVDPIDTIANSERKTSLYGSHIVNNGMLIFGDSEQYMLSTSNDLLSSETVNVTKVANYSFNRNSYSVDLGTNLGFISDGATRFYETTNVYDRGPIDINERSQPVQTRFSKGFNMAASNREQASIFFYKRHAESPDRNIMLYRYRQENSQESSVTSWVRWALPIGFTVCYLTLPKDSMFAVVKPVAGKAQLWSMNASVADGLPVTGPVVPPKFLDGWRENSDGNVTGTPFLTRIDFPTFYAMKGPQADVNANLTIHRIKFNTAAAGPYEVKIRRGPGYDPYDMLIEQTEMDGYNADYPQLVGEKTDTIPVYTRNRDLTIRITTDFDAPFGLNSVTWEGDYNPPYYNRG